MRHKSRPLIFSVALLIFLWLFQNPIPSAFAEGSTANTPSCIDRFLGNNYNLIKFVQCLIAGTENFETTSQNTNQSPSQTPIPTPNQSTPTSEPTTTATGNIVRAASVDTSCTWPGQTYCEVGGCQYLLLGRSCPAQCTYEDFTIPGGCISQCGVRQYKCNKDENQTIFKEDSFCSNPTNNAVCVAPPNPINPVYDLLETHFGGSEYNTNYKAWETRMRRIGLYPLWNKTNSQIVFLGKDAFLETDLCKTAACTQDPTTFTAQIADDMKDIKIEYFKALGDQLADKCYVAFNALEDYIPEVGALRQQYADSPILMNFFDEKYVQGRCNNNIKDHMTQQEFDTFMSDNNVNQYIINHLNQRGLQREESWPVRAFIEGTGLIYGTRGFINFFAQFDPAPGGAAYEISMGDMVDIVSSVGDIAPLAGRTFRATHSWASGGADALKNKTLNMRGLASDERTFKQALKDGSELTPEDFDNAIARRLEEAPPSLPRTLDNIDDLPTLSPNIRPWVEQTAGALDQAFPGQRFKIYDLGDAAAGFVVYEDNANKLYKVSVRYPEGYNANSDATSQWINTVRQSQLEAKKLNILNGSLSATFYRYIPPTLTNEELRILDQAGQHQVNGPLFENDVLKRTVLGNYQQTSSLPIIITGKLDLDPQVIHTLEYQNLESKIAYLVAKLKQYNLFPDQPRDLAITKNGDLLFSDVTHIFSYNPGTGSTYEQLSVNDAILEGIRALGRNFTPVSLNLRPRTPSSLMLFINNIEDAFSKGQVRIERENWRASVKSATNSWVEEWLSTPGGSHFRSKVEFNPFFEETLTDGRVFVIDDNVFKTLDVNLDTAGGFVYENGDAIFMRKTISENDSIGALGLAHEAWHLKGRSLFPGSYGFNAGEDKKKIALLICEIMTDWNAERGYLNHINPTFEFSGYAFANPVIKRGIFDRLVAVHPELLDDFIYFSLSRNGPELESRIIDVTGKDLLHWFTEDAHLDIEALRNALRAALGGGAASGIIIDPSFEVTQDIFLDNQDVQIEHVPSSIKAGDNINVEMLCSNSGILADCETNGQKLQFVLKNNVTTQNGLVEAAKAQGSDIDLTSIETSPNDYEVTIPDNVQPGNYGLEVKLEKGATVLDTDEENIIISDSNSPFPTDAPEKTITNITVQVREANTSSQPITKTLDIDNPQLDLDLSGDPDTDKTFNIEVKIDFSDNTKKDFIYTVNYQPNLEPEISPSPTTSQPGVTVTPSPQRVTIQGVKINPDHSYITQGVSITAGNDRSPSGENPYSFETNAGNITAQSAVPAGFKVSYSICANQTGNCHTSFTNGSSVSFYLAEGYADIWWMYTPTQTATPTPTPNPATILGLTASPAPTCDPNNKRAVTIGWYAPSTAVHSYVVSKQTANQYINWTILTTTSSTLYTELATPGSGNKYKVEAYEGTNGDGVKVAEQTIQGININPCTNTGGLTPVPNGSGSTGTGSTGGVNQNLPLFQAPPMPTTNPGLNHAWVYDPVGQTWVNVALGGTAGGINAGYYQQPNVSPIPAGEGFSCGGYSNQVCSFGTSCDFRFGTSGMCVGSSGPPPQPPFFGFNGTVFIDSNQNAIKDAGEMGYDGAKVRISQSSYYITSGTDSTGCTPNPPFFTCPPHVPGAFNFDSATAQGANHIPSYPTQYIVTLDLPSGYRLTTPANVLVNIVANNNPSFNLGIIQDNITPPSTLRTIASVELIGRNRANSSQTFTKTFDSTNIADFTLLGAANLDSSWDISININYNTGSPRTINYILNYTAPLQTTIVPTTIPTPPPTASPSAVISPADRACPVLGDASDPCDGRVTGIDFQRWVDEFTGRLNTKRANFNPEVDDRVSGLDFQIWSTEFLRQ